MGRLTAVKATVASSAILAANIAAAGLSFELGLQQQRWLEDNGEFVSEDGFLPRAVLAYRSPVAAPAGWDAQLGAYIGDVSYRGANQNNQSKVYSHSRYRGLDGQLERWWRPATAWRLQAGVTLQRWRRDIYNPLQGRDQAETLRVASLHGGVGYALGSRVELGAQLNYPFWVRVEAGLGDFGYDRSPVLQPRGRLSPGLSASWRVDDDFTLRLLWERQRFAASPLQAVGTAQVHQPASRMDRLLFGVARNF